MQLYKICMEENKGEYLYDFWVGNTLPNKDTESKPQ